jgi:tetratricopeptide (TPR) repeat protein
MSLFVDVVGLLSEEIKAHLMGVIENEKEGQERSVRKICDVCSKYLEYGELRYDKMEDGIRILEEMPADGHALYLLLLAVLNESLDEDHIAVQHLAEFSGSGLAEPFRAKLNDFINLGRVTTLREFHELENAGLILVEKYTDEAHVAETIANLYFKVETTEYLPAFLRLLNRAKELYPASIQLESLGGFFHTVGKNYELALASFLTVKERLEQNSDSPHYNFNLASIWDTLADCYLKLGNAEKTSESCDIALSYAEKAEDYMPDNNILYKKAEAFILLGEKDNARAILKQLLEENEDDEKARAIQETIR